MTPGSEAPLETIRVDGLEDGRVLRVTLDHPKGNILSMKMMAEIGRTLAACREDAHLRFVFLRGAGGNFSFGASVEEHRKDQAPAMLRTFHTFVRDLAAYPVPVASLVEGRCLGGAFEVALVCHLVFATPGALFACPEIKLGVFPPVLAAIGETRLGGALAERLLLTGGELDAESARSAGLVTAILPDDDPEAALLTWYRQHLDPLSAFALRQGVRVLRTASALLAALDERLANAERQYVEEVLTSHDGTEGISSFLERRPSQWQDR